MSRASSEVVGGSSRPGNMSTLSEILLKPGQGQNDRFYDYDF